MIPPLICKYALSCVVNGGLNLLRGTNDMRVLIGLLMTFSIPFVCETYDGLKLNFLRHIETYHTLNVCVNQIAAYLSQSVILKTPIYKEK